jgi:regulator of sigma E protease
MTVFVMIAQLILGLALLVFVHELGHFFAARAFKIRVPKFYLFFNPTFSIMRCKKVNGKLRFKFFAKNLPDMEAQVDENNQPVLDEKGKPKYQLINLDALPEDDWRKYPENTEYGIGWLPLGGYCQIAGMIDETQSVENMASEPQPWEYRSKPAWQRLIVILAGVMVNLVIGVLLFAMVIGRYEKIYLPNDAVTDGIYAFQAARDLGFESGDKIISIDGKKPERFKDAISPKLFFGAMVEVERNGQKRDIVIGKDAYEILKGSRGRFIEAANYPTTIDSIIKDMPAYYAGIQKGDKIISINDTVPTPSWGAVVENIQKFSGQHIEMAVLRNHDTIQMELTPDSTGTIGIYSSGIPYHLQPYSLGQTFSYGWKDAMGSIWLNIKGLGKIFSGEEKATESLSGPIGIAQIYGGVWDWKRFWSITGLLSLILAFMNVLPIPGLDGGHAIFTLVELITGRKVSDKVLQSAQTIGMLLLFLLMFFVIFNDIFKLFM